MEHEVYVEQPPTVVGVTSKYPGRLDWKRSSATPQSIFSSFRTSQKVAVFAQEKWLHSLSMGDTHSEVTIMPLEDFDFLQHHFLLTWKVSATAEAGVAVPFTNVQFVFHSSLTN